MMKKVIIWLILLLYAFQSAAVDLRLWATTDVHGAILSENGGLARILSLLEEKRSGDDILIDAGDLYHGSYAAAETCGSIVVNAFNLINYDVFVPGNHDFEFGSAVLRENLQNINAAILCCNWRFRDPLKNMKPYKIFERNNVRIGIVGVGEKESRCRIMADDSLLFADEAKSIASALAALRREKVDVIVLVRHGGIYFSGGTLYSLLKIFPEIDIVIGGHSHQTEIGRNIAGAYYVQSGAYGNGVSEIIIDFDEKNRRIRRISSLYHEVGDCEPSDKMSAVIQQEKRIKSIAYRKLPWKIPSDLKDVSKLKNYLIKQCLAECGPSDADILLGNADSFKWNGVLNRYAIYRMFPYDDRIVTLYVTEKEYETILEECRKYSKKYKVPLIAERHDKSKKYFLLRTSAFVLSGGGRNFPLSRNIAEQKKNGIKEYPSLRQLITEYLAGSKTE